MSRGLDDKVHTSFALGMLAAVMFDQGAYTEARQLG